MSRSIDTRRQAPSAHPAPLRVESERLILRRPRPDSDAREVFAAIDASRARLGRWLPWLPTILTEQDERAYMERVVGWWDRHEQFHWLMFTRDDHRFAGMVGTARVSWAQGMVELGYWAAEEAVGLGLVTEAVSTVQGVCFAMGFHRVEVRCSANNQRSSAVPRRLGYTLDGELREDRIEDGGRVSTQVWSLLATDSG